MILHISHNDLDGIGCTVLTKAAFGGVDVMHTTHSDIDQVVMDNYEGYDTIIISDIVPSEKVLAIVSAERDCTVIDHHASTAHFVGQYHEIVHDITVSATMLTYRWLTENGHDVQKHEYMVELVNDYDLWILNNPQSLQLNLLYNVIGIASTFERLYGDPFQGFHPMEAAIITTETERMESYLSAVMENAHYAKDTEGLTFGLLFAERYASELGNRVLVEVASCDYVVIINMAKNRASLRSSGGRSILAIAQRNGGGGHSQAAGFSVDASVTLDVLMNSMGLK